MVPSRHTNQLGLSGLVLVLLSLLSIVAGLPISGYPDASNTPKITFDEYVAYLKKYFSTDAHEGPITDRLIHFSGNSLAQVKNFQAMNPGYYCYDDLFNTHENADHPWYKAFGNRDVQDDGDASSKAMASVATKEIRVFGAAEYETKGLTSFYTSKEARLNKEGVTNGRLSAILHMAKDAVRPDQIMIKEDGSGNFHWQDGYEKDTPNATDQYNDGEPRIAAKGSQGSSSSPASSCRRL